MEEAADEILEESEPSMPDDLARRLVVSNTAIGYSPLIEMTAANAIFAEVVVLRSPAAAAIRCQAQQGNDGENWTDVGSNTALSMSGITPITVTGIGARWVRLSFNSTGSAGQSVVGVSTATKQL
jgi:hypothetical protein